MFLKDLGFELKKLFKGAPMKVALILNCAILVVFAIINMYELKVVREKELQQVITIRNTRYAAEGTYQFYKEMTQIFIDSGFARPGHDPDPRLLDEMGNFFFQNVFNHEMDDILDYHQAVVAHNEFLIEAANRWIEALQSSDYKAADVEKLNFMGLWRDYRLFVDKNENNRIFAYRETFMSYRPIRFYDDRIDFLSNLLENNIKTLYENEMTPFNFIYQVFQKLFPFYFLIIIAFVCFKAIAGNIETTAIIFSITLPVTKIKLFLTKYTAACAASLFALFAPLLAAAMILGFVNGFDSPRYPVLIQERSYACFEPLYNGLEFYDKIWGSRVQRRDVLNPAFPSVNIGISKLNLYDGWTLNYDLEGLKFTPIYLNLLLTLPLYFAETALFVAFTFILGITIKKRAHSFGASFSVAAVVGFVNAAPLHNLDWHERLNPLLTLHASKILGGLGSVTALNALLVCVIPTIFILSVCCAIFHRLEA